MSLAALRRLTSTASHLAPSRAATAYAFAPRSFTTPTAKLGAAASSPRDFDMSGVKELVDKAIKEDKLLVFSKSYCPYCKRAKALLEQEAKGDLTVFELDERDDGADIQAYLKQLNGQGTVPHVYIAGEFIGGNSDLQGLPKDTLRKKIAAARSA